ncbi:MAG: YheU family protein [Pseudomonadota bacterium]
MGDYLQVPIERIPTATLEALLEEFASRDGTDYGEQETSLRERVAQLRRQLLIGDVRLLFNTLDEKWDLLDRARANELLAMDGSSQQVFED